MTDALRFEWTRIRTLRSTYWLTVLALVLGAAVAGIIAWVKRGDPIDPGWAAMIITGGSAFSSLPFTAVFMGILGAFSFGHEYRHGTILATLSAVPRRGSLAFAKCLVVVVWSFAVAVLSVALNFGVARVLAGKPLPLTEAPADHALLGYVAYIVLWALLGLGLASLLRNMPATLVILLVVPLVVEPLISALAMLDALRPLRDVVHYLPFTAGKAMTQSIDPSAIGGGGGTTPGDQPSRLMDGVTFTAWVGAIVAVAVGLFHKRDA